MVLYYLLLLCTSIGFSYSEDDALQEPLRTAEVGGSINLECRYTKQRITTIIWFRQKLGQKPHVIATSYQLQAAKFYDEFEKNTRFDAKIEAFTFNLNISNVQMSDSATYYCAVTFLYDIMFGQGTVLIVKDKSTLNQQEKIQMVTLGEFVTQCTVVTNRCVEDHRVYWFKYGSGKSQSGLIYTQSSNQCEQSFSASLPTQTCVYKLPNNLSLSEAGTYYCAVAACGEILFGNGTKTNIEADNQNEVFVLLAIIRSAVLLITFIICLLCMFYCTHY